MNIIKQEFKQNFKSWLIWFVSLSVFVTIMMLEFSAYKDNPELLAVLDAFPKEMLEAFGLNSASLTTVSGFVSVSMLYMQLMAGIYAIMLGANQLAKERKSKTSEFIFVMPVKREVLLSYKWIVGLIYCGLMSISIHGIMIVSTLRYEPEVSFYQYISLSILAMFILLSLFMSLGLLLASVLLRPKLSLMIGPIIVFVMYIMSVMIGLVEALSWLRYLTPFEYFDPSVLLSSMSISWEYTSLSLVFMLVAIIMTMVAYHKKDIPV